MRTNMAAQPVDKALDAIETNILPSLSALLSSVVDVSRPGLPRSASRSAELRDVTRQIIELTEFLAAVTANASQARDSSIRA